MRQFLKNGIVAKTTAARKRYGLRAVSATAMVIGMHAEEGRGNRHVYYSYLLKPIHRVFCCKLDLIDTSVTDS